MCYGLQRTSVVKRLRKVPTVEPFSSVVHLRVGCAHGSGENVLPPEVLATLSVKVVCCAMKVCFAVNMLILTGSATEAIKLVKGNLPKATKPAIWGASEDLAADYLQE